MRGLTLIAASLAINFAIAFISHELGRRTCPAPDFETIGEITQVAALNRKVAS